MTKHTDPTPKRAEDRLARCLSDLCPRAILFDLDGTLVDSTDANFRALDQAWAAQGERLDRAWYAHKTGLSVEALAMAWGAEHDRRIDGAAAIGSFIAASVQDAAEARLFPDAAAALRDCARRMPVGVVTNNFRPIVEALVEAHFASLHLGALVTADTEGLRPKPAPDLYARAVRVLALPPADCVAIEDSDEGLAAARAAGLRAVDIRALRERPGTDQIE